MTWFRIECGAADDRLFDQLGEALGISTGEAFYHYFAFTGRLAHEDTRGNMRDLLDRTIEKWGKWAGTPGGFSRVLRGLCEDPDTGELRGFRARNEKLLEKQAKDRKKKKKVSPPADESAIPQETPAGFSGEPPPIPRANVNVNRTTTTTTTTARVVDGQEFLAVLERMTDQRHRSALEGYCRGAHDPQRFLDEVRALEQGLGAPGGKPVPIGVIGAALHEMALSGSPLRSRVLLSFIRRALEDPATAEPRPAKRNGNHTAGTMATMERFLQRHAADA